MKIAVALSGGVDSSVAAYMLKRAGYDLFGLFMKSWEEEGEDGCCTTARDREDAIRICELLDIPCYTVDFTQNYWDRVFTPFLEEIERGTTPNPDILCNREIKFKALHEKARMLGADRLATGHYCREKNGMLFKGRDPNKDQSYFLYPTSKEVLETVRFPIGNLLKSEVRRLAKEADLPVFGKKESMGICFIGKRNFSKFLEGYIPTERGVIETVDGRVIGSHKGVAYYTIGQRRGMGIGGKGGAWFVVKKEVERNALIVAQGQNHPSLFARTLLALQPSWIGDPPSLPLHCKAKIRYRQREQSCTVVEGEKGTLAVSFSMPQRAITPGQSIVFYDGELCLGGAIIQNSGIPT